MNCKICNEQYNNHSKKPYIINPCQHTFCFECLNKLENHECPDCKLEISDEQPKDDLIDSSQKFEYELKNEIELKLNDSFEKVSTFEARLEDSNKKRIERLVKLRNHVKSNNEILMTKTTMLKIFDLIHKEYTQEYEMVNENKKTILEMLEKIKNDLSDATETTDLNDLNEKLNKIDIESEIENVDRIIKVKYEFHENYSNDLISEKNSNNCIITLNGHTGSVRSLVLISNDKFASGSTDGTIKIWNVKNFESIKTFNEHGSSIRSIIALSDNKLASASYNKILKIWDLNTCECIKTFNVQNKFSEALSIDESFKSSVECDDKILNEKKSSTFPRISSLNDNILSLTALSNHKLVSGNYDSTIKIWDYNTGKCIKTFEDKGHNSLVLALVVLSNDRIVSGSGDSTIKIWDVNSGQCLKTLNGHSNGVISLLVTKKDNIISGSRDKTIKVWDLNSFLCIKTLKGHTDAVCSLATVTNDKFASGSQDNSIKIWNFNSGECIKTLLSHTDHVATLVMLSNNNLASGSYDGTIKIWNLNNIVSK